jgi:hypothetical protein
MWMGKRAGAALAVLLALALGLQLAEAKVTLADVKKDDRCAIESASWVKADASCWRCSVAFSLHVSSCNFKCYLAAFWQHYRLSFACCKKLHAKSIIFCCHALLLSYSALCCNPPTRAAACSPTRRCRSLILVAEPFGFGEDGRLNITVSKFTLWSKKAIKKYDRCVDLRRCVHPCTAALFTTQSVDPVLVFQLA